MKGLEFKIDDGGLWIEVEVRHSRFEDLIMTHQHLVHTFSA